MQKRSHKLLASSLLRSHCGFAARRYEWAFLFGSFQPDCNPLTYLRGIRFTHKPQGHNFVSTQLYINRCIRNLQRRSKWSIWQYYTLGKLTHYLADAFTYPHNEHYPDSLMNHHRYEAELRRHLDKHLARTELLKQQFRHDLTDALDQLHRQYMASRSNLERDIRYILDASALLMACCVPSPYTSR